MKMLHDRKISTKIMSLSLLFSKLPAAEALNGSSTQNVSATTEEQSATMQEIAAF